MTDRSRREARAEALLERARRLALEERKSFLDVECASNPALRAELEALLPFAEGGAETPSEAGTTIEGDSEATPEGDRIGPYRLLEPIGEGGMGEVFLAEQTEPVRRRVALKLIKAGMDSKQVLARFEAERQALALMDHSAIARVYDAGATPRGLPYFAMEYVRGEPITSYCDRHRLSTRERIELFRKVCDGVAHAHLKGIIHRDLKPSNVLVSVQDRAPVPKIIDFGVAKATSQRLTEKTMFTQMGMLVGTPEYMSPEQAEMTGLDVDTRSDVYSLGVMLYELLVGALPIDLNALRTAGFDEIRRRIREDEPSRPSTKVTTLGGNATAEVAQCRRTTVPALRKELKGDLDWIVMRALEKDRTRRYASPAELAADLGRHLVDEPVLAGPPGQAYRLQKFLRRHRLMVTAAALVLVALVAGFLAALFGLVRARHAERTALEEAATARQMTNFVGELFAVSDPSRARGNSITAREVLDRGAQRIESDLADQPEVQARLKGLIGNVYRNLGLYDEARPLLEASLAIQREIRGEDHPDTLLTKAHIAWLDVRLGSFDEARELWEEVRDGREKIYGTEDRRTLDAACSLGYLLVEMGRTAEAEPLLVETVETASRVLGEDLVTFSARYELGFLYMREGRDREAEPLALAALEGRRDGLGEDHPDTLDAMNLVALVKWHLGRVEEAARLNEETLAIKRRVLGDRHSLTLYTMSNLAWVYMDLDRFPEAESLFRETLTARLETLGENHRDTAESLEGLGVLCRRQGRHEESEQFLARAVKSWASALGEDKAETLWAARKLGLVYLDLGRAADAVALFRNQLEILRRISGEDGPRTVEVMAYLGMAYGFQEKTAKASEWYEKALEARERLGDEPGPALKSLDYDLGCSAARLGRRDEALRSLRRAVENGYRSSWMASDPDLVSLHGDPEFESLVARVREGR